MRYEYSVVWKRVGIRAKRKKFAKLPRAQAWVLLLGPEPWKAAGVGPGACVKCGEEDCMRCTGEESWIERAERYQKTNPAIEWIRIEQREVGAWTRILQSQENPPATQEKEQE